MRTETAHFLNLLHYLILFCHPHAVLLVILIVSMLPSVILLYTPMVVHTLLIWPMSPTYDCKPSLIPLDHSLMEEPMVVG